MKNFPKLLQAFKELSGKIQLDNRKNIASSLLQEFCQKFLIISTKSIDFSYYNLESIIQATKINGIGNISASVINEDTKKIFEKHDHTIAFLFPMDYQKDIYELYSICSQNKDKEEYFELLKKINSEFTFFKMFSLQDLNIKLENNGEFSHEGLQSLSGYSDDNGKFLDRKTIFGQVGFDKIEELLKQNPENNKHYNEIVLNLGTKNLTIVPLIAISPQKKINNKFIQEELDNLNLLKSSNQNLQEGYKKDDYLIFLYGKENEKSRLITIKDFLQNPPDLENYKAIEDFYHSLPVDLIPLLSPKNSTLSPKTDNKLEIQKPSNTK